MDNVADMRGGAAAFESGSERTPPPVPLCSPALRGEADAAFAAGNHDKALQLYTRLATLRPDAWPHRQLGLLARNSGDLLLARTEFLHGVALAPKSQRGWCLLANANLELGLQHDVETAARELVAATDDPVGKEDSADLTSVAHFLFENARHAIAYPIYELLLNWSDETELIRARYAEGLVFWKSKYEPAIELLEPFFRAGTLSARGLHALARAYGAVDRPADAGPLFENLLAKSPGNFQLLRSYIRFLGGCGDHDRAREIHECARAKLNNQQRLILELVLCTEIGDYERLLELAALANPDAKSELKDLIDQAIRRCTDPLRNVDMAKRLLSARVEAFGITEQAVLAGVQIALKLRDIQAAGHWFEQLRPKTIAGSTKLQLAWFRYLCSAGRTKEAKQALEKLRPFGALKDQELRTLLNQLSQIGDWDGAYECVVAQLGVRFSFEANGLQALEAVRKTSRHQELVAIVEAALARDDTASMRRLRDTVLEDAAHLRRDDDPRLRNPRIDEFGTIRDRLVLKEVVCGGTTAAFGQTTQTAIYFCADRTFLGAALVSLTSLLNSNRDLMQASDLFLIVDGNDVYDLAKRLTARLAEKYAIAGIVVLERTQILAGSIKLKTEYGIANKGRFLPEVAYDRIYFAQALHREHCYKRALYIDADTLVVGNLNPLLQQAWPAALLARLERTQPGVEHSIRQNGFTPGQYFNSGVLALQLDHADFGPALERTLHAMHREQDKLLLHDQCALNLGFQGKFAALDPRYNAFVLPNDTVQNVDGEILHYTDRPKPWDPAYRGGLCRAWFLAWYQLALHVGNDDAMRLLRMANEG